MRDRLPIDDHLDEIRSIVDRDRALVIVAPPGAGKTTRVPPALLDAGTLILLQPRRVAARSLASRIAAEQKWVVGREVGWQVRHERAFSRATRLLVATEGILTARLLADPLLENFATIVLDEFHERSVHADLSLALAREAARARHGLRIVVMSASLEAETVAGFLGGCPVVDVPVAPHPVDVSYAPDVSPRDAILEIVRQGEGGHVLCFLPGVPEIRDVGDALSRVDGSTSGFKVVALHGSVRSDQQDEALAPSSERKVILATNIAETSLTIDGVDRVIDTGLQRALRFDPCRGFDRLETERISFDSAIQRTGRAGRTGPGQAVRLWDSRELLRPHREPEIHRVDLTGPVLSVLAWGGDPRSFTWFDPPAPMRLRVALDSLEAIGAMRKGKITSFGRRLSRLPLHPRLGTFLLRCNGSETGAAACAILAETRLPAATGETTNSDLLALVDRLGSMPGNVRKAADQIRRLAASRSKRSGEGEGDNESFRRAVLAAWPDRVARRREPGSDRLVLANGTGARLTRESGVRDSEFLVAVDMVAGARGPGAEARIRIASAIDRSWLEPTAFDSIHEFDAASGRVRAVERSSYGALVLVERFIPVDPDLAASILAEEVLRNGMDERARDVHRRLRFAGIDLDVGAAVRSACEGETELEKVDVCLALERAGGARLAREAPQFIALPRGRRARLEYREDGTAVLAARIQELFGATETPRIGTRRVPVLLSLLAPSGRPVQTTADLASFWRNTYSEVRKELRGRYPKHDWPEDPLASVPPGGSRTARR